MSALARVRSLFSFGDDSRLSGFLLNMVRVNFLWSPLFAGLVVLAFGGTHNFGVRFLGSLIISFCAGTSCMVGSKAVEIAVNRLFRARGRVEPARGAFFGVTAGLPFMLPGMYWGFMLSGDFWRSHGYMGNGPDITDYSSGIMIGMLVASIFLVFELIREQKSAARTAKARLDQLETERLKAEVSALSAQLNPHLLFNSLNTIAATIPQNPNLAEDMVVGLADLYRDILRAAKKDQHSLAQELAICRSYLEIEQHRFGERVQFAFDIDPTVNLEHRSVPVLLIQPLVENALKHGLAQKLEGGSITVTCRETAHALIIEVRDTGLGRDAIATKGEGTGLENCASRLRLLYGEAASFDFHLGDQGCLVTLKIPYPETHDV